MTLIATWNVNSLRARLEHVCAWIEQHRPGILLLQEIKCQNGDFPNSFFDDLGYNIAVHGQKTFNGVAILSRFPLEDIQVGLPEGPIPEEARYIEALVCLPKNMIRVASVYVPNGQEVGSVKYDIKLSFFNSLREHMKKLLCYDNVTCIGGDYNVAPAEQDVHDPQTWDEKILCSTEERRAFESLINVGYSDAFRQKNPTEQAFTWWDYRGGAFQKNQGLRIDHFLLSPQASDILVKCWVDMDPRAKQTPSDHAPVLIELDV